MKRDELLATADRLSELHGSFAAKEFPKIQKLHDAAQKVGRAWSGSNLGYHADVYYAELAPPPPGAQFSPQHGLDNAWPSPGTIGDWQQFSRDAVISEIYRRAGNPALEPTRSASANLTKEITVITQAGLGGAVRATRTGLEAPRFLDWSGLLAVERADYEGAGAASGFA